MAPPELARDAPGLDVLHPVEIGLLPVLRHELGRARRAPPRSPAAPASWRRRTTGRSDTARSRTPERSPCGTDVRVRLDLLDRPCSSSRATIACAPRSGRGRRAQRRVEIRRRRHACDEIRVIRRVELAFDVEDVDLRQVVPLADLEIVEVVRRRDLDRAGALLGVGIFVGDDRDAAADQRQDRRACRPDACSARRRDAPRPPVSPSIVSGRVVATTMNVEDRRIEARLRSDSAKCQRLPLTSTCCDLEIGDRGQQLRVPVDQPLVLVDQALRV